MRLMNELDKSKSLVSVLDHPLPPSLKMEGDSTLPDHDSLSDTK
jgi:hypothetical protein